MFATIFELAKDVHPKPKRHENMNFCTVDCYNSLEYHSDHTLVYHFTIKEFLQQHLKSLSFSPSTSHCRSFVPLLARKQNKEFEVNETNVLVITDFGYSILQLERGILPWTEIYMFHSFVLMNFSEKALYIHWLFSGIPLIRKLSITSS